MADEHRGPGVDHRSSELDEEVGGNRAGAAALVRVNRHQDVVGEPAGTVDHGGDLGDVLRIGTSDDPWLRSLLERGSQRTRTRSGPIEADVHIRQHRAESLDLVRGRDPRRRVAEWAETRPGLHASAPRALPARE